MLSHPPFSSRGRCCDGGWSAGKLSVNGWRESGGSLALPGQRRWALSTPLCPRSAKLPPGESANGSSRFLGSGRTSDVPYVDSARWNFSVHKTGMISVFRGGGFLFGCFVKSCASYFEVSLW